MIMVTYFLFETDMRRVLPWLMLERIKAKGISQVEKTFGRVITWLGMKDYLQNKN